MWRWFCPPLDVHQTLTLALRILIYRPLEELPLTLWFGFYCCSHHMVCFDSKRAKCLTVLLEMFWILPSHRSPSWEHGHWGWVSVTTLTCFSGFLGPLDWPWVSARCGECIWEDTVQQAAGLVPWCEPTLRSAHSWLHSHLQDGGWVLPTLDICERSFKWHWRFLVLLLTYYWSKWIFRHIWVFYCPWWCDCSVKSSHHHIPFLEGWKEAELSSV